MQTSLLNEIAREKMRRTLAAAQAPSPPLAACRTGIGRWIRPLVVGRLAWRPPAPSRPIRIPSADPAYRA